MNSLSQSYKTSSLFSKEINKRLLRGLSSFLISGLCLSYFSSLQAVKVIDIEQVSIIEEKGKAHVQANRVAVYDTTEQKFLGIHYYLPSMNYPLKVESELLGLQEDPNDFSFKVPSNNIIDVSVINKEHLSDNYAFNIQGKLMMNGVEELNPLPGDKQGKKFFMFGTSGQLKPQEIINLLEHSNNNKNPEFKILKFEESPETIEYEDLKDLNGLGDPDERGKLGELATFLTMKTFGYKYSSSQNGSSQGFDGVYYRKGPKENKYSEDSSLFITESKCRKQSKKTTNYMESELNEREIHKRLRDNSYHPSTNRIKNFIFNRPENIFKSVHRIKKDGVGEWCVKPFDPNHYRLYVEIEYPNLDYQKEIALFNFMERFGIKDIEGINALFKKVNELSSDTLKNLAGLNSHKKNNDFGKYSKNKFDKLIKMMEDWNLISSAMYYIMKPEVLDIEKTTVKKIFKLTAPEFTLVRGWNAITENFDAICEEAEVVDYKLKKADMIKSFKPVKQIKKPIIKKKPKAKIPLKKKSNVIKDSKN